MKMRFDEERGDASTTPNNRLATSTTTTTTAAATATTTTTTIASSSSKIISNLTISKGEKHHILGPESVVVNVNNGGAGGKAKKETRTTKSNQKLVLFPEEAEANNPQDDNLEVETSVATADAATVKTEDSPSKTIVELSRDLKQRRSFPPGLQRVTAYCAADSYQNKAIMRFLKEKSDSLCSHPKIYDEALYSTYASNLTSYWQSNAFPIRGKGSSGIIDNENPLVTGPSNCADSTTASTAKQQLNEVSLAVAADAPFGELFIFEYGVIVIWGLREEEEHAILRAIRDFSIGPVPEEEIETEHLSFRHDFTQMPARICNDIIYLKSGHPLVKLTISHAIAQSVKLTLYENRTDNTINTTKHIPVVLAKTGDVHMSRTAITRKIGRLFIMRINVNLISNILDVPELFWSQRSLKPLYNAVRGYLEISQRVEVLNQRCLVISDLLDMLSEHLNGFHAEKLEWTVIILIVFEIFIGIVEIYYEANK